MKKNIFLTQLGDYFDVYLPNIRRASPNTIAAYGYSFSIFFEFLYEVMDVQHTSVTYKHLTPALFDEFILWMTNIKNYSATSVRQRMTAISSFLKYASQREMSALKPYTSVMDAKRPNAPQEEFSYFTVNEMKFLLSLPNPQKYLGPRDLVFLSVLYDSAARAQEMCNLRVGDIRFSNPVKLKIHGKGKKEREVPISDEVAELLKYHLKQLGFTNKDKDSYIFLSQTNEKMTTACVRSIVKKYVGLAQKVHPELFVESSYSPHSFRHSKAVHMVEAGVDLICIRNFLGHEHISTTEIYARVGQEAVTKALTDRRIPKVSATVPKYESAGREIPDFIKKARKNM